MDVNRIFSADQITVPTELPLILKEWTKAAIREQPIDIFHFSHKYFQEKVEMTSQRKAVERQVNRLKQLFESYDVDGAGRMEVKELHRFLTEEMALDMTKDETEDLAMELDPDNIGFVELKDLVQWFKNR